MNVHGAGRISQTKESGTLVVMIPAVQQSKINMGKSVYATRRSVAQRSAAQRSAAQRSVPGAGDGQRDEHERDEEEEERNEALGELRRPHVRVWVVVLGPPQRQEREPAIRAKEQKVQVNGCVRARDQCI
jgi:hypothetical protein